jgi:DNA polymerase III epsilon subunit-like protein
MKVLVFDTETTGLPIGRNPSIMDVHKWPHIVQISYILFDTVTKQIVTMRDDLIKIPLEVEITPGSEAIHHISREMCDANGIYIKDALNYFNKALGLADVIVGHNISFDKQVIMVECRRSNIYQKFTTNGVRKEEYCTMKKGAAICEIVKTSADGNTYFKYPTLTELHQKLFDYKPEGTHDALVDVLICLRCYVKIADGHDFMDSATSAEYNDLKNLYISRL